MSLGENYAIDYEVPFHVSEEAWNGAIDAICEMEDTIEVLQSRVRGYQAREADLIKDLQAADCANQEGWAQADEAQREVKRLTQENEYEAKCAEHWFEEYLRVQGKLNAVTDALEAS